MPLDAADLRPHPLLLGSVVTLGICAISSASMLIRMAEAPTLAIATYRVGLATLLLVPWQAFRRPSQSPGWTRANVAGAALAGAFLAFHFLFWIKSLAMTSVASSVTLVSTHPFFVALGSRVWLGEKAGSRLTLGIVLTAAGSALVAGSDFHISGRALIGDLLALLGSLMAAGYLLTGKSLRRSLSLSDYTFAVYGAAALILLLTCAASRTPLLGFPNSTYLCLLLLAAVPQLVGHTSFNWALRFLPATVVAVLILGEPIGASLLAYLVLHETISTLQAIGLTVLLAGIVLSASAARAPLAE